MSYVHHPRGRAALGLLAALLSPGLLDAQQHHGLAQEAAHHAGLHFSHPLFTESVSPDTKIRFNAGRHSAADETEWELELEGEYAFHRSFSIEVGAPFITLEPDAGPNVTGLGNLEIMLKFANYAFERSGLLLGYGLEVGIPSGNEAEGIGSDHLWELAPLLNFGLQRGRLELVGFARFGIPFNQRTGEEVETELAFDLSGLVHLSSRVQGLVELNGETVLSGAESGETVTRVSVGGKFAPSAGVPLFLGLGMRRSLSVRGTELRASLFYHF